MKATLQPVSAWGRLNAEDHEVLPLAPLAPHDLADNRPGLAFGMGRSYGDVCLNTDGRLWNTQALNRFLAFDATTGLLTCEAGVLLRDIQSTFVKQGWMLAVTPGTQFVTVGGAIANDVHGKNHHVMGTFGNHVGSLWLQRTDGRLMRCGPQENVDWFAATVGGLGLTGLITEATIRLRKVQGPWLDTETLAFGTLKDFFTLSSESEKDFEYTVSWIDCAGGRDARGIFMRGNHGAGQESAPVLKEKSVPVTPPMSLINAVSLRVFNTTYYHWHRRHQGPQRSHYRPFFYPLDAIGHWNRIYGPRGFFQHQCVLPHDAGHDGIAEMLQVIKRSHSGSFLAVLKTFGDKMSPGMLSFPRPGVTLALDFPNQGEPTRQLLSKLDAIVQAGGGRIYAAKDACMPRALFESGYPGLNQFRGYRDPGISSDLSRRLMGA